MKGKRSIHPWARRFGAGIGLLTLAFLAGCGPSAAAGASDPAITAADLKTRLYVLADDSMGGRRAGTDANLKGTAYIAAAAQRIGLEPAGDSGTFFQDVPLVQRTVASATRLTVGGRTFTQGTDYTAMDAGRETKPFTNAAAIFGGTLGEGAPALTPVQVRGRFVVFALPERGGFRRRGPALPDALEQAAAAIATINPDIARSSRFRRGGRVTLKSDDAASAASPATPSFSISEDVVQAMFGKPASALNPGATGQAVSGAAVFEEHRVPGRNVVAILRGSDPVLRNEYVAIGAHNDHTGTTDRPLDHDSLRAYNLALHELTDTLPAGERATPEMRESIHVNVDSLHAIRPARMDSVFNGADDDGSGSVTVLEIAQAFAAAPEKPKRSLIFVWHTAEELGLYGSRYFTDHPTVPRDSIVAQLNMDMVGRGSAKDIPGGGPNYLQLVGSRRLSTELGDLVEAVNAKEPQPFTFDYTFDADGHPDNIYCRSDHYNYARYGIPVTFFTTGLHADYHQLTDEPQYIDYEHMAHVATLVHDVAAAVANLDHRPVVDHPKPDPNARCRQ